MGSKGSLALLLESGPEGEPTVQPPACPGSASFGIPASNHLFASSWSSLPDCQTAFSSSTCKSKTGASNVPPRNGIDQLDNDRVCRVIRHRERRLGQVSVIQDLHAGECREGGQQCTSCTRLAEPLRGKL